MKICIVDPISDFRLLDYVKIKNHIMNKTEDKYTITFVAGTHGSLDGEIEYKDVLKDQTLGHANVVIPTPVADKYYVFTGWYNEEGTKVELSSGTEITGDATYTAKFGPENEYTKYTGTKLNLLGRLLLENNIQDVDIKIRNISFLIDIILQKYFGIQIIPELDLLKFPRLNIIMNKLFFDKNFYFKCCHEDLVNYIFEHFILSQFILSYIKYMIKDPEHYPIEIRYFVIFSYINLSEDYLTTNPFSSYVTAVTFREIINFLKLEKGFHKQKYIKKASQLNASNDSNLNNSNLNQSLNKSSQRKSNRRRSISRTKKNKKKNKKKSIKKQENPNEKINYNIDINLIESYAKNENDSNSQSGLNNSKVVNNKEEKFDEPEKVLSKAFFNYLCFLYSMADKFKSFSEYFTDLYSFIDDYIDDNIKKISLDDDWTWLLIYSIDFIENFDLRKTYEKFGIKVDKNNVEAKVKLIAHLSKKVKYCNTQEHFLILDVIYNILINMNNLQNVLKSPKFSDKFKKLNRALSYLSFIKSMNAFFPASLITCVISRYMTSYLFLNFS